jgi:hypothetical protein
MFIPIMKKPAQSAVFSSHRYGAVLIAWLALLTINPAMAVSNTRAKQEGSAPQRSGGSLVATLLVQADMDCTFRLDDQPGMALKANEPTRVQVGLGEHLLNAVSLDGRDHWKQVVELAQPVQKVVLIDLVDVRMARQRTEPEAVQSPPRQTAVSEPKPATTVQSPPPQQTAASEPKPAEPTKGTSERPAQQDAAQTVPSSPASVPIPEPSGGARFSVLHTAGHTHSGFIVIANGVIKFSSYDGDRKDGFEFPIGQVKEVNTGWLDGTDGFHIRLQNGKNYRFIPCKPPDSGSSAGCSYKNAIPNGGEQMAAEIRAALAFH